MVSHLMSWQQISSEQQLQHIKLFLDCCCQFCKATHDESITPFWLSKGNYVTLLNLPEKIERFGPLQDYWNGSKEQYIQLIKQKLVNILRNQSFMAGKLTKAHQSHVLDWIMHNLDSPFADPSMPRNGFFHTYSSRATIIDHFKNGKILRGYHHPQHHKHVIMAYCQAD